MHYQMNSESKLEYMTKLAAQELELSIAETLIEIEDMGGEVGYEHWLARSRYVLCLYREIRNAVNS